MYGVTVIKIYTCNFKYKYVRKYKLYSMVYFIEPQARGHAEFY